MAHVAFDPFEALGLDRHASSHAVKSAYHALARKYHPSRHQGAVENLAALSEHFHHINQAWRLLSNADNRRRRAELLGLVELQNEILGSLHGLLEIEREKEQGEDPSAGRLGHLSQGNAPNINGNTSSDADEDLPHVGIHRRHTVLRNRGTHPATRLGNRQRLEPSGSAHTSQRPRIIHPLSISTGLDDKAGGKDYFTLRRKKLEKLRRKELDAFMHYRDAVVSKFEAEELAEKEHERYIYAKWRREYFERAPRETTERLRSLQRFLMASRALSEPGPRSLHTMMSPDVASQESNQWLVPDHALSRRKSVHRRAWSNDLSGDQTSSDSDSDDHPATKRITPPNHWNRAERGRDPTFDTFRQPPGNRIEGPTPKRSEKSRASGEFRLVIRQPTDFSPVPEHDSSQDTVSASSRSPSPYSTSNDMSFTVVSSLGAAALFDVLQDRPRSMSPGGHRRSSSLTRLDHESHNSANDLCQLFNRSLAPPQHRHIPNEHVHILTYDEKARMLGSMPDVESDPAVLMQRLAQLNFEVAAKFMVKPDTIAEFNFRLIHSHREVSKRQHDGFIALSYRRKLHVEKHEHHYTLPLDTDIFQAVWDERQDDNEGLWVDQICIDQDSDLERTISMSAMDLVYRGARLIVVALDDIELEAHEGEILQAHMAEYASMAHVSPRQRFRHKKPPFLESHDGLYQIIKKVLRSSWFVRAWCRHEMRLAKQHIFLIPSKKPGFWIGRDVLRLNSKCIAHLLALSTEVPFEPEVEGVKPALYAFFRDRNKIDQAETQLLRSHHGNFTTVVAEVFAMEAGGDPRVAAEQRESDARKDKMAIICNASGSGLALQPYFRSPSIILSQNECFHDLLLVALAAQDPGALCSVGTPLPASDMALSWMFTPTVADAGLNNSKTLQRIPAHAEFVTHTHGPEHYIQLDLKFLRSGSGWHPQQDELDLARCFVTVCDERKWGRNRSRYLIKDRNARRLFGPVRDIYIETLACLLHCGPDWMSDVCQRYGMGRWKVDLQGAYELLIALKNTFGKWPPSAWRELSASFVMDFVNFLVIRGLPQRQITKPEAWRPICVPTMPGGMVLTFIPMGHKDIRTAVPTVLSHPDYIHLARLWVLEPKAIPSLPDDGKDLVNEHHEWTLLGKSVVFSDSVSIEQMHQIGGEYKSGQKVLVDGSLIVPKDDPEDDHFDW